MSAQCVSYFCRQMPEDLNITQILTWRISTTVLVEEKSDSNTWSWTSVFWRRGWDQTLRPLKNLYMIYLALAHRYMSLFS